jgi:hypothetical protein
MENPKLLERVEDAIKRLMLPEISALEGRGSVCNARATIAKYSSNGIESPILKNDQPVSAVVNPSTTVAVA